MPYIRRAVLFALAALDYMAPEVLVCPDKRRPEENKDKVLLGYTAQVGGCCGNLGLHRVWVGRAEERADQVQYCGTSLCWGMIS